MHTRAHAQNRRGPPLTGGGARDGKEDGWIGGGKNVWRRICEEENFEKEMKRAQDHLPQLEKEMKHAQDHLPQHTSHV